MLTMYVGNDRVGVVTFGGEGVDGGGVSFKPPVTEEGPPGGLCNGIDDWNSGAGFLATAIQVCEVFSAPEAATSPEGLASSISWAICSRIALSLKVCIINKVEISKNKVFKARKSQPMTVRRWICRLTSANNLTPIAFWLNISFSWETVSSLSALGTPSHSCPPPSRRDPLGSRFSPTGTFAAVPHKSFWIFPLNHCALSSAFWIQLKDSSPCLAFFQPLTILPTPAQDTQAQEAAGKKHDGVETRCFR
jgi:hypothetical protein